jgi:hypothetical protein
MYNLKLKNKNYYIHHHIHGGCHRYCLILKLRGMILGVSEKFEKLIKSRKLKLKIKKIEL